MRYSNIYYGAILGFVVGLAIWAVTSDSVIGIASIIVLSIVFSLAFNALDKLLHKGVNKAADVIKDKIDNNHKNINAGQVVGEGKKVCPYCGSEINADDTICSSCGKSLEG